MPKFRWLSRLQRELTRMNGTVVQLLKLGFFLVALDTCILYIILSERLQTNATGAYLLYEQGARALVTSLLMLLIGTTLLDRLFRRLS